MKKQTALLLSSLVVLSAVSMQPAHAFKCKCEKLKFWEHHKKPAVTAPAKKEVAPAKKETPVSVVKEEVKKVEKKLEEVKKPEAKPACPCAKPAVKPAVAPAKPVAKPAAKAPVKK